MTDAIRSVKGYVKIRVWGVSPERFMNLCSNKGILLWDIQKQEEQYVMCISLQGFYKLRPIARKTGTRAVVMERHGLPFFLPGLWARKAFVAGLLLSIAFWWISGKFVWDIRMEGNVRITDEVLEDFLKSQQVMIGMRQSDLDINALEKALRQTFPEITWTSAKLDGTKLLLSIKENDAPIIQEAAESVAGQDLVAEYDGVVTSIVVRSGVPFVKAGDQVTAGTILVEGRIPVYQEDGTVKEYLYVDADADIRMEHETEYVTTLPINYVSKVYTGREKKGFYLRVGNSELFRFGNSSFLQYDQVIRERTPEILHKLGLYVYWGETVCREYLNTEYQYTVDQVEEIFQERLLKFISTLEEKGVQIIEKNVKIESSTTDWSMSAFFTVDEDVGEPVPTTRSETPVSSEQDSQEGVQ